MKTNKQLPETMRIMDIDPRNARQGGKAAGDDNESGSAANTCRPEHVPEGRIPAGPAETGWRRGLLASVLADSALGGMQNAAREFQKLRQQANGHSGDVLDTWSTPPPAPQQPRLIWEASGPGPAAPGRRPGPATSWRRSEPVLRGCRG